MYLAQVSNGGDKPPTHRERLRAKLLNGDPDALSDHEMLELVLFLALPRIDTRAIARRLLTRFGSFANVIAAPVTDCAAVKGMGQAAAAALKIVDVTAVCLTRAKVSDSPLLSNWDALIEYLNASMARHQLEQFRVLFLDNKNRLLSDEIQAIGTFHHKLVHSQVVIERALKLKATAFIMANNHNGVNLAPSREAIATTRQIVEAAKTLSIVVHDHVILGSRTWLSFRQEGLL